MNIGLVGLGFMGSTHLQAYQQARDARLVAVASEDEKKLQGDLSSISGNLDRGAKTVDFGDAARYRGFDALIGDPRVEAVDLCTPSFLHASQAVAALNAGKHVLVEKPMALDGDQCDRMIAAAERNGKVLMVAQVLRFWPDFVGARSLMRSGALGKVRHAFFYRKCAAPAWSRWMHDREKSGGGVFDLLIHDFDYCRHVFGKPTTVMATGVENLAKGVDVVEAHLTYPDGPQVTIAGGWRHPKAYPFSMEFTIVCDEGTLDFRSGSNGLTLYRADGESEEVQTDPSDAFAAEIEAFVQACEKGETPAVCPPRESADAIRMTLAMRESRDRGGEPVALA